MHSVTKQSGFTLIELLLYVSIVGVLLASVSGFYALVIDARVKTRSVNEVNQQGAYIMDYLTQSVRSASSIAAPAAGASASSLSLVVPTATASPTGYSLSSGVLQVSEGAAAAIPLSSSAIQVSNLTFKNLSATGTNGLVQISFTIARVNSSGLNRYDYTKTFTSSAEVSW